VIDLHLHTTASDGRLSPAELVDRAARTGLTTIAVTDHDTVHAVDEVTRLGATRGMRVVPGMEITAVDNGRDVHILGYFFDHADSSLADFLSRQRGRRAARVREIGERLAALGAPVDVDVLLDRALAAPGTAIGRPWLARALVKAGHVDSVADAFDRYLGTGKPAFVPRLGPRPHEVVTLVHDLGGVVSFAHPGVTGRDDLLGPLVDAGLDAIEVHHSDHSPDVRERYRALASALGVATSGGSDFHGFGDTRAALGLVVLPPCEFEALEARASGRPARSSP